MTFKCVLDEFIIIVSRTFVALGEFIENIFEFALDNSSLSDLFRRNQLSVCHVLTR